MMTYYNKKYNAIFFWAGFLYKISLLFRMTTAENYQELREIYIHEISMKKQID